MVQQKKKGTAMTTINGIEIYPLRVDYGRSVEEGVKAGRYDLVNPHITSHNFPTKRKGVVEIRVELVHFDIYISTDEVLHEFNWMGYRPADLRELLAFGENYPEVQRKFPVVALGSVWRRWDGHRVPYLLGCGSLRYLGLGTDYSWFRLYRFAAVRK
jgi:hypothetical protein